MELVRAGLRNLRTEGVISTGKKAYARVILPQIFKLIFYFNNFEKDESLLLFGGSEYGRGNGKYVFEYIHENRPDLNPVWLTTDESVNNHLEKKGLSVVRRDSFKALYLLRKSKIGLLTNGFHDIAITQEVIPDEMTLIFIDHGSPVKFGQQMKSDGGAKKQERLDYRIKLSEFHAEHRIKYQEVDEPTYLLTGFPRNDVLIESNESLSEVGIESINPNKIILYAPTKRRADRWNHPVRLFPFDDFDPKHLHSFLEDNDSILLINLHPTTMQQISDPSLDGWAQPLNTQLEELLGDSERVHLTSEENVVQANELMAVADILITDYSSMYHDYLILDRPIIFFPYDYSNFENKLGFSYDYYENLPGPAIESFDEFQSYTERLFEGGDPHADERQELREKLHTHPDGGSTERVVAVIDAIRKDRPIDTIEDVDAV